MKHTTRRVAAAGALATALALGGAGIAMASTAGGDPSSTPGAEQQEPSLSGSVPAPQDANAAEGADTEQSEADESASLKGLATLTAEEAKAAAIGAVPGTAAEPVLENENGFVVYAVEVTAGDGAVTEVKVDAGDGSVLAQEADDAEGGEEGTEQPEN